MICPACRHDNPARAKFCLECGARMAPPSCPQCGTELPPGAKFCLECGHRVAAVTPASPPGEGGRGAAEPAAEREAAPAGAGPPPAAPVGYTPAHLAEKILRSRSAMEGERRQVTVLFADMAGFTTLAEKLDPEEVHGIVDRCFDAITAEVHRFEGTINQYTGDGVMALFGAPIAHEDGPRRAVHAALGIQRALRDLSRALEAEGRSPIRMRIGLHTGPVVVGRIGDDLRMDYTAVGDTTNLAARMQQMARPGSVRISEATQRAVAAFFETLDLGEVAVKGRAAVRAHEVLRARGRRSRLEAGTERGLTPLVGRAREVETLMERFADVTAGHGQVVTIAGEAGIGKSRLLLEFRRRLAEAGADVTWLEGQCISFGQSIPFVPLIDQLRQSFGIEEFDGEPEIVAKVEHGMRRMGELETHIPYVRFLLSVDPGDAVVATMDAAGRRRRIFEAVRALTARGCALRPLVLVFEDLHWVDSATEEYLTSMMDSVAGLRLLLLLTHRLEYTPRLGSRSFQSAITLRALSAAEAVTMAARVLGGDDVPEEVRAALMEKAEGVPLYVEEVTKTLLDLGVLRREEGGLRMVKRIGDVSVPDTIQGIIMARLDRLGEEGKRMVQLASVIGRQFLQRLLERIAGLTGRLDGLLAELKALEIIYEQGLLPEPAYIFKHAVIQDVAYQSLLVQRRRELHRGVATAIEELYPDRLADHYEELAHHFSQGEDWAKAFEYLVLSADRAKVAYANDMALDGYARALQAASRVTPPVPPARIMDIHQRRGQVLLVTTRIPEAIAEAEAMLALARAAGDRGREARALADLAFALFSTYRSDEIPRAREAAATAEVLARAAGDDAVLAQSLSLLGSFDQVDGELVAADAKFREAIRVGETTGLSGPPAQALMYMGAGAIWRGDFREGIRACGEARAAAARIHDGMFELLSVAFVCLSEIGLGDYTAAVATIGEGLEVARARGNAFIEGRLTNSLGWLHQELGDFEGAREHDRRSMDIGRRISNHNVEISARINAGVDELHLAGAAAALPLFEEALTSVEKLGFGVHRWRWGNHLSACLAEACLGAGDLGNALRHAERGMEQARATGALKYLGLCQALRGEVALAERRWTAAREDLEAALQIAREIAYPTLTWQAAHGLALALAAEAEASPAARGAGDRAGEIAELAAATVAWVRARAPEPALARTFLDWPRVQRALADVEKLRRR